MTIPFDEKILEEAYNWVDTNQKVVLATVVQTWGSSPRKIGSKMIVNEKGDFSGSVSGGCVESAVIGECIELIKNNIRNNCSPKHVPAIIIKAPEIPRTKSGKIVELAVRKLINGQELNNKEAIANPESLDFFKNLSQLKT